MKLLAASLKMKFARAGLLFLSVLTMGGGVAWAADAKVYPAALCATTVWNTHIFRELLSGAITSDRQTDLWCPIIGDNESTTGSSGLKTVTVHVNESTNTPLPGELANTKCTVKSYGILDGVPYDSNSKSASGSGKVTLPNIPLTKTTAPTPISPRYILNCQLKGGSTMYEYEIEEQ